MIDLEIGKIYGVVCNNDNESGIFFRNAAGVLSDVENYRTGWLDTDIFWVSSGLYYDANLIKMSKKYKSCYSRFDCELLMELASVFSIAQDVKISKMSIEDKKILSIIFAIASNAKYILFQNTFDDISALNKKKVVSMLMEKVDIESKIILISSKNLVELEMYCDAVLVLKDKQIMACEDIDYIKTQIYKVHIIKNKNTKDLLLRGNRKEIENNIAKLEADFVNINNITIWEFVDMCMADTLVGGEGNCIGELL